MVQGHLLVAKTGTEPWWLWHTAQTPPPPAPLLWAHSACRQLGVLVVETKSRFPLQEFIPSFSGHCPLPKGSCLAHAYTSLQGQPACHNWLVLGLGETQRTISLPQYRTIQDPLKGPFKLHPCPPRISWGLWFNCITVSFSTCPVLFPLLHLGKTIGVFQNA